TTTSQFNGLNQVSSSSARVPSYDASDNQKTLPDRGAELTYDAFGHVAHAVVGDNTIDYSYDALGRPIIETRNGIATYFTWDQNQLAEYGNDVSGYYTVLYGGADGREPCFTGTGVGHALTGVSILPSVGGSPVGVITDGLY